MNNDLINKITSSLISANPITTEKRNLVVIDIPPADSYLLYALKCKEYVENSRKWAENEQSPDSQFDVDSPTGKTQSSKEWALTAKKWAGEANVKTVNGISSVNGNIEINTIKKKLYVTPETPETGIEGGQITLQKAPDAELSINIDNSGDKFRVFGNEQIGKVLAYAPLNGELNGAYAIFTATDNPTFLVGQPNNSSRIEIRDKTSSVVNPGTILLTAKNIDDSSIFSMRPNGSFVVNTNNAGDKPFEAVESKGGNYIRYTNGLQICFNATSFKSTGTVINFAQPFSSQPVVIAGGYGTGNSNTSVDSITVTNFKGYNSQNWNCGWLAIGYWK